MNINKLFQKYTSVLLILFMGLMVIAFLLPPEMFQGPRGNSDFEIGTALGQRVMRSDVARSQQIINIAQGIGLLRQPIDAIDAHLLMLEAKLSGVQVGPNFIRDQLSQMQGIDQIMAILRERNGMSYEQIYASLGEWAAVQAVAGRQMQSASPSRPRQILAFRDRNQQADVRCAVIQASDLVRHVGTPNEDEIRALFEAGKDRDTEHTDTELVYGYRQPARVKLEILTVNPDTIRDLIRVRDTEAEAYYEANREQFMSVPDPQATGPAEAPRQLTYEEASRQVKDALRPAKAIEEAQRLVNELHREARNPWIGAEVNEAGFRKAPAGDIQVSFEALKAKYEEKTNYDIDHSVVEFSSETELSQLPIGQARIQAGSVMLMAPQYALRTEGLYTPETGDGGLGLALNEPSEVVIATRFNPATRRPEPSQAFLFRVTAIKPAGPPENIEEVRETVESNLKFIKAYAMAEELANELFAAAQQMPLANAVNDAINIKEKLTYPMLNVGADQPEIENPATNVALGALGPTTPRSFSRDFQQIRGVPSGSAELAELVFDVNDPAQRPLNERTFVVGNTTHQAWIVAQVEGIKPIYEGDFDQQRNQIGAMDMQAVMMLWMDSDAIRERTGWQASEG